MIWLLGHRWCEDPLWIAPFIIKYYHFTICNICVLTGPFCRLCALAGSTPLRTYPLLSVITHQPPSSLPQSPHLLSPQHPLTSEPTPSETPVSISSESETEHSTSRLKKPRRSRTIFTELQLLGLEKKFQKQKYLSTPDRSVDEEPFSLRSLSFHAWFYSLLGHFSSIVSCKARQSYSEIHKQNLQFNLTFLNLA